MKAIFNGPMVTSSIQKASRLVGETADIVSGFVRSSLVVAALALDTHQSLQVAPAFIVADIFKSDRVSNGPTAPNFNTSVVLVYDFGIVHVHLGKALLVAIGKPVS